MLGGKHDQQLLQSHTANLPQIPRSKLEQLHFFGRDMLQRLPSLEPEIQAQATADMLKRLPVLLHEDRDFGSFLSGSAFVPISSGKLRAPRELFDPRWPSRRPCDNADHSPAAPVKPGPRACHCTHGHHCP